MRCLDTWILVVVLDSGRPLLFFFNDTAPTEIYTLSLHDALPILAVAHGPAEAGYLVGSEAMVNIRATLAEAFRAGIITPGLGDRLIGYSKDTFYPRRSWERLLEEAEAAGASPAELRLLAEWLPRGRVDRKRLDAVAMLRRIAADRVAQRRAPEVAFRFNSTTMWEELQTSIDQGGPGD